ncbi:hypothetical protein VNO77_03449 [Canavalia gladiata]|uniref:Uncharacterized protein n=1 Tax=Canavalia gladiata TaxID=3824 RepID=A0AAN9MVD6_CANGL
MHVGGGVWFFGGSKKRGLSLGWRRKEEGDQRRFLLTPGTRSQARRRKGRNSAPRDPSSRLFSSLEKRKVSPDSKVRKSTQVTASLSLLGAVMLPKIAFWCKTRAILHHIILVRQGPSWELGLLGGVSHTVVEVWVRTPPMAFCSPNNCYAERQQMGHQN